MMSIFANYKVLFLLRQVSIAILGHLQFQTEMPTKALEWAKLDVNGRSHNDPKPAIFHRSKRPLRWLLSPRKPRKYCITNNWDTLCPFLQQKTHHKG